MALTPAERMKRYRERLKLNPEKLESIKKKHAEYVKSKSKTVKDLTEKEKEKQRKIWRNQKRKQKQLLVQEEKGTKKQKIANQSKLIKNYKTALKRNQKLTKLVNTYKKRLYRLKISTEKKIQTLEKDNLKLKARTELLELTLKTSYKQCQTVKEKQTLKNVVLKENIQSIIKKTFVSKLLGLKGMVRITNKNKTENKIRKEIENFYVRDDVSRMTAGKKQCRTFRKKKEQIRYLTDTVRNLYTMYRKEGGKYSLSTFNKYKPFYVLSPAVQNRETCLCIKHNNMQLMFYALKKYRILNNFNTVLEVTKNLCCDINSKKCMYEECKECKDKTICYEPLEEKKEDQVKWSQWEVIDHKYTKTENKSTKELTTKKTLKLQKVGSILDLRSCFEKNLKTFKMHHFNWIYQQKQYQKCVKNLQRHEALIICDFSENYACKMGEEIQATHFGASKNQITLHTGMIYWAKKSLSFCTISDNNSHEPAAIWAHLLPVINEVRKIDNLTKVIHFYSDGPTSQYRQKKNFYLLNLFTEKLKLDYTTWSFSEAGHGKGVADGIGASVKRALDRQVAFGRDVENGSQAYEHLSKCMNLVKIIYIPENDIENIQKLVPQNLKTIIGTMKIHQLSSCSPGLIQYRNLSCFCGTNRGLCNCFDPKTHAFNNISSLEVANSESTVIDISDDAVTDGTNCPKYSLNIKKKEKSFPKVAKKCNSNFEVITFAADIHVDNLDCLPKLRIPDVLTFNKENVDINQADLPIPVNSDIMNIDTNLQNVDDVIYAHDNNYPAHTTPEDLDGIVIDLMLDEEEKKLINATYDLPYFDANDDATTTSSTDNTADRKFQLLFDNSIISKPFETDHVADKTFIQINDKSETPRPRNKRVSTVACSSAEPVLKKVKIEILKNRILLTPNKMKIVKSKTEQNPVSSRALKTTIKRTVSCNKCKNIYLFYNCMTKCSKCELFYCGKCITSSKLEVDDVYVCDTCVQK
ncbi:uncharacterized protein LOC123667794 [Melitaea cinxia]|uniref:uncharacterized protein LOC123667794 n=1 Tax=Melitaea cinxia TaxID=113334 RepID=UPI001E271229|nr:uncharacterized protein LOC123667794 [Melitaea cinxia]